MKVVSLVGIACLAFCVAVAAAETPTDAEFSDLVSYCDTTWTQQNGGQSVRSVRGFAQ